MKNAAISDVRKVYEAAASGRIGLACAKPAVAPQTQTAIALAIPNRRRDDPMTCLLLPITAAAIMDRGQRASLGLMRTKLEPNVNSSMTPKTRAV
jgi:hypothetical protein